jgi:hypothetical protein
MKISKYWYKDQFAIDNEYYNYINCWAGSNISEADAKAKAQAKVQDWTQRLQTGEEIGDYEYQIGEIREELIEEVFNEEQRLIAAITRNRYGALILNTDELLIADVDISEKTFIETFKSWFGKKIDKRTQCLQQIKACYQNHQKLNFIIYETYAGFRIIITGYRYTADAPETHALFAELNADKMYVKLCRIQECFRARLTPKPWRCQAARPQQRFPRLSSEHQAAFSQWLRNYEVLSEKYAVCYKIEQLGKNYISATDDKILALHDAYVLKPGKLPLA